MGNRPSSIEQKLCQRSNEVCSPVISMEQELKNKNGSMAKGDLDYLRQRLQGSCMRNCGTAQYIKAGNFSGNLPHCFALYNKIAAKLGSS